MEDMAVFRHVSSILWHFSHSVFSLNLGSVIACPVEYDLEKAADYTFCLLRQLCFWNSASQLRGAQQVESISFRQE